MRFYKIVMSKGDPLIVEELKVEKILEYDKNLVRVWDKDHIKFDIINKSHIVQIYFDHETNKQEYELVDGVYKLKKEIQTT